FRESPPIFDWAREHFAAHIDRWGYQESRDDYEAALREADVIVSTANHEFFGISVVEAIAAGAYPLLPRRLAYPEILTSPALPNPDEFFHDGGADQLARKLKLLADRVAHGDLWQGDPDRAARTVARFHWTHLTPCFDRALEQLGGTE
ncbi:MAG: glycosyltransferase, partial [Planctomycetes bacterium]|nr:glycosyltransferase [Planctomycetota bacterium]